MDLLDVDGDHIHFLIDPQGRLREYVNGKLELEHVQWLAYDAETATLEDEKGQIVLQEKDRVEKALGVHCLAMRAGVPWRKDPPVPAQRLAIVDTDGDQLEFIVNEDQKLQEYNNGELDLDQVTTMCFKFSDGSIRDDTGVFTLPPRECMQKVAALYSLAMQAGIRWTGDNPQQVSALPVGHEPSKALDIENCAGDWELECPLLWENLTPTDQPNRRFCKTCGENVYFCDTIEEVNAHAMERRCVAFEVREAVATEARVPETDDVVKLHVALLSGDELPELTVPKVATVNDVKEEIANLSGIPSGEQRLLLEGRELENTERAGAFCETSGTPDKAFLQLLRVLKPVREPTREPGKVKMGKRRPPRRWGPF
ncbi:unnamed protein product [Durusdinium trenchii]|uniref:Ubiquitin-like domain-containing protein n=2 Tax=Durusdinium trenchii TaxID=1381693 RepID=A0ABP0QMQ4_9DINO